jgi:hypothetical protein
MFLMKLSYCIKIRTISQIIFVSSYTCRNVICGWNLMSSNFQFYHETHILSNQPKHNRICLRFCSYWCWNVFFFWYMNTVFYPYPWYEHHVCFFFIPKGTFVVIWNVHYNFAFLFLLCFRPKKYHHPVLGSHCCSLLPILKRFIIDRERYLEHVMDG